MLDERKNLLFQEMENPTRDLSELESPTVIKRKKPEFKRELRDLRRQQNAAEILAGFDKESEFYGFTKGQFSVVDLLQESVKHTGRADLVISTWTASKADVSKVLEFLDSGKVNSARWLVDLTFQNRSPELAHQIRQTFGMDAIRVAQNHSKFFMLSNDSWKVICQTSMNLNYNPRFENFNIKHDPELFDFHQTIVDEIWAKQTKKLASKRPAEIKKFFKDQM